MSVVTQLPAPPPIGSSEASTSSSPASCAQKPASGQVSLRPMGRATALQASAPAVGSVAYMIVWPAGPSAASVHQAGLEQVTDPICSASRVVVQLPGSVGSVDVKSRPWVPVAAQKVSAGQATEVRAGPVGSASARSQASEPPAGSVEVETRPQLSIVAQKVGPVQTMPARPKSDSCSSVCIVHDPALVGWEDTSNFGKLWP
jgi:hypothetical protein